MYKAVVTKIKVRPHPNADRIQLGMAAGFQVIVGLGVKDGDIGIYFPEDGQLSQEYCDANDLVAQRDEDGKHISGGFFCEKRRVKTQNFRGEKSQGYWAPLDTLQYVVKRRFIEKFKVGDEFNEIGGVPICNKYETEATKQAKQKGNLRKSIASFPKHFDTNQFAKEVDKIPEGSLLWITEKLHGTSHRFGYVRRPVKKYKSWFHKLFKKSHEEWEYGLEVGSRNIVLNPDHLTQERRAPIETIGSELALAEGEIIYGEIVGFTESGKSIMPNHTLKDKKLRKKYGDEISYSYGCATTDIDKPLNDFYVYRITRTDSKGRTIEYGWREVMWRAGELGLKTVPKIFARRPIVFHKRNKDKLVRLVDRVMEGSSTIDNSHIREGVVIRVDNPSGATYFLKAKSHTFKLAEGIAKDDDNYVDPEEIS